ncbi:hypothetical protein FRC19_002413 [Serendipita sp. 401]|nr:hypothetical protein FRC19_002413 [Serendipita sp. 401]KAG9041309.1 hypothetical protein FS842_002604 [Serendipita sp. 407]
MDCWRSAGHKGKIDWTGIANKPETYLKPDLLKHFTNLEEVPVIKRSHGMCKQEIDPWLAFFDRHQLGLIELWADGIIFNNTKLIKA